MMNKSELTGKWYQDEDCVFFRNYVQAAHYIAWQAKLIDLFTDSEMKLVFVFSKKDHEILRDRWGTKKENYFNKNQ